MFARLCLIFLILIGLAGCDRPPPLVQQESYVFGTRVEILVAGAPEKQAREAAAAVPGFRPPAPDLPRLAALGAHGGE